MTSPAQTSSVSLGDERPRPYLESLPRGVRGSTDRALFVTGKDPEESLEVGGSAKIKFGLLRLHVGPPTNRPHPRRTSPGSDPSPPTCATADTQATQSRASRSRGAEPVAGPRSPTARGMSLFTGVPAVKTGSLART